MNYISGFLNRVVSMGNNGHGNRARVTFYNDGISVDLVIDSDARCVAAFAGPDYRGELSPEDAGHAPDWTDFLARVGYFSMKDAETQEDAETSSVGSAHVDSPIRFELSDAQLERLAVEGPDVLAEMYGPGIYDFVGPENDAARSLDGGTFVTDQHGRPVRTVAGDVENYRHDDLVASVSAHGVEHLVTRAAETPLPVLPRFGSLRYMDICGSL
ncbi:MAG: hypothetical protein ABH879_00595 [archaeon]